MMKNVFWLIEDILWNIRCSYNLWLHGPYGLAKVIEKIPFRYLVKYLRKYGATIGENCRFERGLNIHRPFGKNKPFENLNIGNNVYLGHNTLIDLSREIYIGDNVIFASGCQIWTHASFYKQDNEERFIYGENFGNVKVCEGAIVYSNVVITHGVTIGKYSKTGASSLVNRSIEDFTFYGGVPIKYIK